MDSATPYFNSAREAPIAAALRHFADHLSRPSSSSFDALRKLLEVAPTKTAIHVSLRNPKGDKRYLEERDDHVREETDSSWTDVYHDMIYEELIKTIEEHGFGDDGWKGARWEVYDAVRVLIPPH